MCPSNKLSVQQVSQNIHDPHDAMPVMLVGRHGTRMGVHVGSVQLLRKPVWSPGGAGPPAGGEQEARRVGRGGRLFHGCHTVRVIPQLLLSHSTEAKAHSGRSKISGGQEVGCLWCLHGASREERYFMQEDGTCLR